MTFELPDLLQVTRISEVGVSHVADNVVMLQYLRRPRRHPAHPDHPQDPASLHEPQIREFTITPEGITLGDQTPTDPASQ
jgi:circadian clock protein KaiC